MTQPSRNVAEGEKAVAARAVSAGGQWVPMIDWSNVHPGNRGVNRHGRYERHDVPVGISVRIEEGKKVGPIVTAERNGSR